MSEFTITGTILAMLLWVAQPAHAVDEGQLPVIRMAEMLDTSTLDVRVLQDWQTMDGPVTTRQKVINIKVGEVWDGQDYRIRRAFAAGHRWADLQKTAEIMADHVFVTRNLEQLNARHVEMYFHPGTHDFVSFDIAWGDKHHPQTPLHLQCNAGHGQKPHPAAEKNQANKAAFLVSHFFDDAPKMLQTPTVSHQRVGNQVNVTVKFRPHEKTESGRIWWMYDRGLDGSAAYL